MEITFRFGSVIILSILSGILYRIGGTNKGTLWRDIGCSLVTLLTCFLFGLYTSFVSSLIVYIITFGLSWSALSAYWEQDEKKWGYWAHGLGLSLALIPIAYITNNWFGFGIRCIILTALITIISEYFTKDWLEEGLRGITIILTIPILLL